jgi:serine/threonine protein kinase
MSAIILGGRYQIKSELGRGGFGKTYLAKDMQLPGNPLCVVKQLKPIHTDPLSLKTARRLFDTEAKVLYQLGHHNCIPQLLAHFEENKEFYLVQEYIAGHSLSDEIIPGQRLSEAEAIALLQEILELLEFVHQQGVIHRDLKPSNLIRRHDDNKIVLIDFGAVKQLSTQAVNSQGHTTMTISIGSPGYVANEQLAGNPRFCSDIYAVGMLGIQALTGVYPKQLPQDVKTSEIIWRDQADVSPALAYVLDKMVRYDYRQRYESIASVLADLKNLSSYSSGIISSIPAKTNPPKRLTYLPKTQIQTSTTKASTTKAPITATGSKKIQKNHRLWLVIFSLLGLAGTQVYSYLNNRLFVPSSPDSTQVNASLSASPTPTDIVTAIAPLPTQPPANAIQPTPSPSVEVTPTPKPEIPTPSPSLSPSPQQTQKVQTPGSDLERLLQTNPSGESEAKMMIGLTNRTQLLFYVENNRFSSNWQDLGIDVQSKTENYDYRIVAADKNKTIVMATAKKPGFKSYTGAIFMKGSSPINKVCQTNSPSMTPPGIPAFNGKTVECANGSSETAGLLSGLGVTGDRDRNPVSS